MPVDIRLIPRGSMHDIVPLLHILNPGITTETLHQRLDEMCTQGYQCAGAYEGDALIGCAGLWITTRYYVGRFIEPDNVLIHPGHQGRGIGDRLMQWIFEYGRQQGCVASELNCYVTNSRGHKFWMNHGYDIIAFHFQKHL